MLADFELIQSEGIHIGLQVNAGKCEVVDLNRCCDLSCFENVQQVDVTNLTLLGAPLGRQAMSSVLGKKISELSSMGDRLSWISSHHALFLLTNCFTLPKLLYNLSTSPCFAHPLLQSFDDLQIYLLQSLLNIRLDDRASQQASLPVRFGGIGIIKATSIASSAYISSKLSLRLPSYPTTSHFHLHLVILTMLSPTGKLAATPRRCSHSSAPLLTFRMRPGFWLVHKRSQVHGWRPYQSLPGAPSQ